MLTIRRAEPADLPAIVAMLADDMLGQARETADTAPSAGYVSAFEQISADPNQYLAVMEDGDEMVGTLQLTFIAGLSRRGALRGQIEAVRIAGSRRGERLGEKLLEWAVDECRARGCAIVQLTTDRRRSDAHRFYDRLGFEPTHIGYKLNLSE